MAQVDINSVAAATIVTPTTGITSIYTDATTKRLASKNDAGVVSDYVTLLDTQTLTNKTITGVSAIVTGALTSSGTAGVGYATGAGGVVTQLTSRTTGVTLNKITGAITLVSAAGSATHQKIIVTNSTVSATDTIICHQKGGVDTYICLVTQVSAGSFTISLATTGGTTTESPVIKFTVIKSVEA